MTDGVTPLWRKALDKAKEPGVRARATSLRLAILDTFDSLGAQVYLKKLATGTAAEKAMFTGLLKACLPLEVHGSLDTSLTVHVVTQTGETVDLKLGPGYYRHPKDAGLPLPAATPAELARVPEDADVEGGP